MDRFCCRYINDMICIAYFLRLKLYDGEVVLPLPFIFRHIVKIHGPLQNYSQIRTSQLLYNLQLAPTALLATGAGAWFALGVEDLT